MHDEDTLFLFSVSAEEHLREVSCDSLTLSMCKAVGWLCDLHIMQEIFLLQCFAMCFSGPQHLKQIPFSLMNSFRSVIDFCLKYLHMFKL